MRSLLHRLPCLAVLLPATALAQAPAPILIEAESFDHLGGWVVDPQFMDQMGSPYALAHGLGTPVADASTTVTVERGGSYRVRVRTKDWVARWQAPGTPGRFEVHVDGQPLTVPFGTQGADWHWQDGGVVELSAGEHTLALHDLTGSEGRCDAILLSLDHDLVPPNAGAAMQRWRRRLLGIAEQPEMVGDFDLVVTGGGIAGTCAALAAARLGIQVALIQDRPVLGGNNSSEVRVWLQGGRNKLPWPRVGDVVAELEHQKRAHYGPANTGEIYEDDRRLALVRAQPNLTLLLENRMNGIEMDGTRIVAVHAQHVRTGRRIRVAGKLFADCTGDACVGALAGADFDMQRFDHMGPCNLWHVCECKDENAINTETEKGDRYVPFPRCPWALDLSEQPFPGRSKRGADPSKLGGWYWESGFDRHPIDEMEYVRDWNFRAMYGAWDALKNVDKALPNHKLNWSAYILGKRESRRLLGDIVLDLPDLESDRQFEDGCVPTGWSNDIHHADPKYDRAFQGEAFISKADFGDFPAHKARRPFWIPFRSLYSRNIDNLMMAGRCLSVTHEALGAVRVMRTCGCMGEIVGMAASLCVGHGTDPRGVYTDHLDDLKMLMARGVGKRHATDSPGPGAHERIALPQPDWLEHAGTNLARTAELSASGSDRQPVRSYLLIQDGQGIVEENDRRWLCRAQLPHVAEFRWPTPVTVSAARIITGYYQGGSISAPIEDFRLQWHDGNDWVDTGANVRANTSPAWAKTFAPVTTSRMRLVVTKTHMDISRLWEVELYHPTHREQR